MNLLSIAVSSYENVKTTTLLDHKYVPESIVVKQPRHQPLLLHLGEMLRDVHCRAALMAACPRSVRRGCSSQMQPPLSRSRPDCAVYHEGLVELPIELRGQRLHESNCSRQRVPALRWQLGGHHIVRTLKGYERTLHHRCVHLGLSKISVGSDRKATVAGSAYRRSAGSLGDTT